MAALIAATAEDMQDCTHFKSVVRDAVVVSLYFKKRSIHKTHAVLDSDLIWSTGQWCVLLCHAVML